MEEQTELGKTTLFWKSETGDLKPLEVVVGNIEPIEPPSNWVQDDKNGFNLSFDMTHDKKSAKNIRKLLYTRIPRKLKKRQKKIVSLCDGKPVKHLRYDYLGTYYWIK